MIPLQIVRIHESQNEAGEGDLTPSMTGPILMLELDLE